MFIPDYFSQALMRSVELEDGDLLLWKFEGGPEPEPEPEPEPKRIPNDWWQDIIDQLQNLDYHGVTDPNKIGIIQTFLVIKLQEWLQTNKPDAVKGSNDFLAVWTQDQKTALITQLLNKDTVLEMCQLMQNYKVDGITLNGGIPPFICGSAEVVKAAKSLFG